MPYLFVYLAAILIPSSVFAQFSDTTQPLNSLVISLNIVAAGPATLSWKNDPDVKNGFFVVEHRTDSGSFEPMVSIKISKESADYKVSDDKPYPGINHYRVKLINPDGIFSYSPIVSGDMSLASFCRFYPNPAEDHLIVSAIKPLEIRILNNTGVLSLTKAVGKGLTAIDVSSLPKGIYILMLISTETKMTMREILYKN